MRKQTLKCNFLKAAQASCGEQRLSPQPPVLSWPCGVGQILGSLLCSGARTHLHLLFIRGHSLLFLSHLPLGFQFRLSYLFSEQQLLDMAFLGQSCHVTTLYRYKTFQVTQVTDTPYKMHIYITIWKCLLKMWKTLLHPNLQIYSL